MTTTTNNYFNNKEDYNKFIDFWKDLASSKKATFRDHILYCLLKNKPLIGNAFTPITNKIKLKNNVNNDAYHNLAVVLYRLSSDAAYKTEKRRVSGLGGLTFAPSITIIGNYGIWQDILSEETKEKLKFYFDNNTIKKIMGVE